MVKFYVKAFLERAVEKKLDYDKKKSEHAAKAHSERALLPIGNGNDDPMDTPLNGDNGDITMTDDEEAGATPASTDLKRKRPGDDVDESPDLTPSDTPFSKRLKENENDEPSPPPPPPPPPPDSGESFDSIMLGHDNALREQETALLEQQQQKEQEERKRLREEEAALERENELNMLEFQRGELKNEATSVMSH